VDNERSGRNRRRPEGGEAGVAKPGEASCDYGRVAEHSVQLKAGPNEQVARDDDRRKRGERKQPVERRFKGERAHCNEGGVQAEKRKPEPDCTQRMSVDDSEQVGGGKERDNGKSGQL